MSHRSTRPMPAPNARLLGVGLRCICRPGRNPGLLAFANADGRRPMHGHTLDDVMQLYLDVTPGTRPLTKRYAGEMTHVCGQMLATAEPGYLAEATNNDYARRLRYRRRRDIVTDCLIHLQGCFITAGRHRNLSKFPQSGMGAMNTQTNCQDYNRR